MNIRNNSKTHHRTVVLSGFATWMNWFMMFRVNLSPVVENTVNTVKHFFQFADFIWGKTLDAEDELVSFDVISLFTKIPVDLAIEVAKNRLREEVSLEKRTSLPVDILIDFLSFCLNTTYFVYDGTYYRQVFGWLWVRLFLLSLLIW